MSTSNNIQKVVDYVEDHLQEALNVDDLAAVGGFSKYHLNRLFSIYTGFSLMGYVRRRRMEKALEALQTKQRIVEIAISLGYSSERAFSRAFLNEFGEPPSHFRNRELALTEKLTVYDLDIQFLKGDKIMVDYLSDVRYRMINAMDLICARAVSENPEDEVMARLEKFFTTQGIKKGRNFGFDVPLSEEDSEKGLRGYEYWLEVTPEVLEELDLPTTFEGMSIWHFHLDAHRYASLRIEEPFVDPFERIGGGWKALVGWMEANDLHLAHQKHGNENPYCLEEVMEEDGTTKMDIFIPVD